LGGAILGGVGGRHGSKNRDRKGNTGRSRSEKRPGRFRRRTYEEEWRRGRIERGEISE